MFWTIFEDCFENPKENRRAEESAEQAERRADPRAFCDSSKFTDTDVNQIAKGIFFFVNSGDPSDLSAQITAMAFSVGATETDFLLNPQFEVQRLSGIRSILNDQLIHGVSCPWFSPLLRRSEKY